MGLVEKEMIRNDELVCLVCGEEMDKLQECHLRCPNCGSEITCSD